MDITTFDIGDLTTAQLGRMLDTAVRGYRAGDIDTAVASALTAELPDLDGTARHDAATTLRALAQGSPIALPGGQPIRLA